MDWLGDHLTAVWLGIAIVLGVAELASMDLILLMLAVGALVGMVLAIIGAPFAVQALVAAGVSIACLALVRPSLVKRLHSGPDLQLGHGKLVGAQGVVTERITGLAGGADQARRASSGPRRPTTTPWRSSRARPSRCWTSRAPRRTSTRCPA